MQALDLDGVRYGLLICGFDEWWGNGGKESKLSTRKYCEVWP